MSSFNIETVAIDTLRPHPRNYRAHPQAQIEHLEASLREYGWARNVVVASDGVILAGHGIVEAARRRGETTVPVHRLALKSTDPKAEKFMVLENEVSRLADDDDAQLAALLKGLADEGELLGTGYDGGDVEALLAELQAEESAQQHVEDPGAEEPPEEPVTKTGDVWLCGEHRVVCGDCTNPIVVDKALDGSEPKLCVTDPPYGVEYDAARRFVVAQKKIGGSQGAVTNDDRADWRETFAIAPCDVFYVWHAGVKSPIVADGLDSCGLVRRALICWVKNSAPPLAYGINDAQVAALGLYHHRHEPCWYAVRDGSSADWIGAKSETTVWEIDKPILSETGHSTQKPVECMARPIRNHSGDVLDPFLGSGTTLIACEQLGRVCYGIEIEPRYVDVSVRRWCKATGRAATLESTGEPFPVGD